MDLISTSSLGSKEAVFCININNAFKNFVIINFGFILECARRVN